MQPRLFQPLSVGGLTLPNRIVVSPMGQHSAENGVAGDWHLMHLGHLAISGAGLLITEGVAVEPRGRVSPRDVGLWTDEQELALARIVAFCRENGGAKLGIQLIHAGRKASVAPSWAGHVALDSGTGGWTPIAASTLPYPGRNTPMALDSAGLAEVRQTFAASARRARSAGFEAIEIHGAHGYLIHNFLSPLSNRREDFYGGTLANRMRYPLEVFDSVREAFPDKPVGVRVSATDWAPGGWTLEETIAFANELKRRGCDFICASSGGTTPEQKITVGPLYQVPFARAIKRDTGLTTIAVGLIRKPMEAEGVLAEGSADLIALARGMLLDPRWPWNAAEELGAEAFIPKQYDRVHPHMRNNDSFSVRKAANG